MSRIMSGGSSGHQLLGAVRDSQISEMKRLLDGKANPNVVDDIKQSCLHIACGNKNVEAVSLLLKAKKLDINAVDSQGWTPLLLATIDGSYHICKVLLNNKGIQVSIGNRDNNTPLFYLCKKRENEYEGAQQTDYMDALFMLISRGADPNIRNAFGETPLHSAAMMNNFIAIKFLSKNGTNMNAINNRGESALHYALTNPKLDTVKLLLDKGADPQIFSHSGKPLTALTSDEAFIEILTQTNICKSMSHTVKELCSVDKELAELMMRHDTIKSHLSSQKNAVRKKVTSDSKRTMLKSSTSTSKGGRKAHEYLAAEVEICDQMKPQLYYARSGPWVCCVHKTKCRDDTSTCSVFDSLLFIEELSHPHLLPVIQLRRSTNEIQMFVPYPSATLKEYLPQPRYMNANGNGLLRPDFIHRLALDIASGLKCLHDKGIVHRSLQSSHIYVMLKEKGDFDGVALTPFYLAEEKKQWIVDEQNFDFFESVQAPELQGGKSGNPSFSADIWSFGLIMYLLLVLEDPYNSLSEKKKKEMEGKAPELPKMFQPVSRQSRQTTNTEDLDPTAYAEFIDLYNVCIAPDPEKRPSIGHIVAALSNHINIRQLTAFKYGPSSWKDWLTGFSPSIPLEIETNNNTHIAQTEGFVIEKALATGSIKDNPLLILFEEKSYPFYAKDMAISPHENYHGSAGRRVLLSVEMNPQFSQGLWNWRIFLRDEKEDVRHMVSSKHKVLATALAESIISVDYSPYVLITNPKAVDGLVDFEKKHLEPKTYKFGVIYRKGGQVSDDDMLSNEHGSPDFDRFLDFIGEKIVLKGWNKYRGGLDNVADTTGTHSVFTAFNDYHIMFHTSTLLPYDKGNPQQLHRKRHIGNDVVVVIFQDAGADPFTPSEFASHFNHVFVVVEPIQEVNDSPIPVQKKSKSKNKSKNKVPLLPSPPKYSVSVIYKEAVKQQSLPYLEAPAVYDTADPYFRDMFITKLINCERVAMKSEQFEKRLLKVRGQLFNILYDELTAPKIKKK